MRGKRRKRQREKKRSGKKEEKEAMVDEEKGEKGEQVDGEKGKEEEGGRVKLKRSRLRPFLKAPSLLDSSILIQPLLTVGHPHSRILRSLSGSKIL